MTFAALFVIEKYEKRKVTLCFSRANIVRPYKIKLKYSQQPKQKIYAHPLFLLHMQAQKKKLSKRKRRDGVISHSAECDKGSAPLMAPPFEKGGRKLYLRGASLDYDLNSLIIESISCS